VVRSLKLFEGSKPYHTERDWDWVITGAPLDVTETYRGGTSEGPKAIREASESIETYSPFLDVDISEFEVADAGDLNFGGLDIKESLELIEEYTGRISGKRFAFLGGEHTVTLGILKALSKKYSEIVLVVTDAHTDLRDEYEGQKINHATWLRRAIEFIKPENVILLGVRSGTREEFEIPLFEKREDAEIEEVVQKKLESAEAVYLSVDIDALDSCYAPGCGNPEPGGLHFKELEELVHYIGSSTNLIGMDIVEVAPRYDVSNITSIAAARILRETIAASFLRD
jgi:agmatinase